MRPRKTSTVIRAVNQAIETVRKVLVTTTRGRIYKDQTA